MSQLRIAHPGAPTRFVEDVDAFLGLTQRQRHIVEVVRSHNGNRSRAARDLGLTTTSVQAALRLAARAGLALPPIARRGPDLAQRTRRG